MGVLLIYGVTNGCQSLLHIHSPCTQLDRRAKVQELMDRDTGGWNLSLICEIFYASEAELISNLPLSRNRQEDELIWRATTNGLFTVKNAYYLEKERVETLHGESSSTSSSSHIWKAIWGLHVLMSLTLSRFSCGGRVRIFFRRRIIYSGVG
jgi:hypothetical protein